MARIAQDPSQCGLRRPCFIAAISPPAALDCDGLELTQLTSGNGGTKRFMDAAVGRPAHIRTSGSVFRIHLKEGK